jgi:hypothetical protein
MTFLLSLKEHLKNTHTFKGKAFNEALTAPAWHFEQVNHHSENYKLGEMLYLPSLRVLL